MPVLPGRCSTNSAPTNANSSAIHHTVSPDNHDVQNGAIETLARSQTLLPVALWLQHRRLLQPEQMLDSSQRAGCLQRQH